MTYVYSFDVVKKSGYGAKVHDIILAYHYAKCNDLTLKLIEGEEWHSLTNYKRENHERQLNRNKDNFLLQLTRNGWHLVFDSLKNTVTKEEVESENFPVWPDCRFKPFDKSPPEWYEGEHTQWYNEIARELFVLNDFYKNAVEELVERSGFRPTDIVLHLRLTDKVRPHRGTVVESADVDLTWFTDEVKKVVANSTARGAEPGTEPVVQQRVFVCTDDSHILDSVKTSLDGIEVVWDTHEIRRGAFCVSLFSESADSVEIFEEMLTFLKNVVIMTRASHLIGAHSSYLFRVASILRHPLPTYNVKDSDIFGVPQHLPKDTKLVRGSKLRALPRFVDSVWSPSSSNLDEKEFEVVKKKFAKEGIVTIPNFLNKDTIQVLSEKIETLPKEWLTYSVKYSNEASFYPWCDLSEDDHRKYYNKSKKWAKKGYFSYSFTRSMGKHYDTCVCAVCLLDDSTKSYQFLEFMSKLTGEEVTDTRETFLSLYEKGDYLGTHHDKNKGGYAFVLSLTPVWKKENGGNLVFTDQYTPSKVLRTITPTYNTLTVFRIPKEPKRIDHHVTEVSCPPELKRISYTGWV